MSAGPDDPEAAAEYIRLNFALAPEVGLSLQMQGKRDLGERN